MSEKPNPYRSPKPTGTTETWWEKLRRILHFNPFSRGWVFANGEIIICDGIAFYIDPSNPRVAYAASPSAENTECRMKLIVAESVRALPLLLVDHPEVRPLLRGRQLVVRMVHDYDDVASVILREARLEGSILDAMVFGSTDLSAAGNLTVRTEEHG